MADRMTTTHMLLGRRRRPEEWEEDADGDARAGAGAGANDAGAGADADVGADAGAGDSPVIIDESQDWCCSGHAADVDAADDVIVLG